jgi:hypothetical protein
MKTRTVLACIVTGVAVPAAAQFKESTEGCLYTPQAIEAALGFKVNPGKGTEVGFAGGKSLSCNYGSAGRHAVMVNVEKMDRPGAFAGATGMAGKAEPVPGDPDKAYWQVGQGDMTDVALTWVRGNSRTQVRVTGVNMKDKAAVDAMRARVLKLPRGA